MTCLNISHTMSLVRWHRETMLHSPSGDVIIQQLRNADRRRAAEQAKKPEPTKTEERL